MLKKPLQALQDENHRLQSQASAHQALDIRNLQALAIERLASPESKREAVRYLKVRFGASQRHLCKLLGLALSSMHYKAHPPDDDQIRDRIRELAVEHRNWGYRRIHDKLKQEGININHKRTERLYMAENLTLKDMRPRRKKKTL
jgi:hypothetical protein